ncbi:MAG TPA: hypothetical protein VGW38_13495 [Chloroflexota bacterium]|nr:hypothetical protein [Chloroflexota bacterium]
MSLLGVLEGLLAGVWLGGYLFTHFVVSPALRSLPLSDAERVRTRSVIGRRYAKLAGPLLLVWLVVRSLQGFATWTLVRLALLIMLAVAVGVHGYLIGSRMQVLAEREVAEKGTGKSSDASRDRAALQRLSARITPVSLIASFLLAVFALI